MPRPLKDPATEIAEFAARSTDQFRGAFFTLARAVASEDAGKRERALERVAKTIGETMALADLFGRRRVWLEVDAADDDHKPLSYFQPGRQHLAHLNCFSVLPHVEENERIRFAHSPLVPRVAFKEAVLGLVAREPRLAESAEAVSAIYRDRHGFALAKSADLALTDRIQAIVTGAVHDGRTAPSVSRIIAEMGGFTESYADTVYRTNLNTAYTAGRFQQAQEPAVREILPALERFSVTDSAVRQGRPKDHGENHLAAHGLIADTHDAIWRTHAPPSGYRCRCGVRLVPRSELRRRGLLEGSRVVRYTPRGFENFRAHPNFGRSPKALIYGG